MNKIRLKVSRPKMAEFCRRNNIQKLAFFGSVLRDDFSSASDVDVLVEFKEGHTPGLEFFAMPEQLSEIIGREVDLLTYQAVLNSRNPIRKKAILESAQVYYVAR
jgi:predicted nucleotidyltransferase